jgi:15-cis-phytoene synthase
MSEALGSPDAAREQLDLRQAERYCQQMARREAKNFYWGFISLPPGQRMAIYALYDFARQVDDEADGSPHEAAFVGTPDGGDRARLQPTLDVHRRRVSECVRGEWSDPVTMVLSRAVTRYAIPEEELQGLIDGVQMDLVHTRYETWEDLESYCRLVAGTIGRMCVRIFGFQDSAALERADELGTALQLTNILRDVKEDGALGRVYLPQGELSRFGVSEAGLLDGQPGVGWEALVDFEAKRAREYYATGLRVLDLIPSRPAACVSTMAGIYQQILTMIEREPRLPLRRRASLSSATKLAVVLRSWLRGALP